MTQFDPTTSGQISRGIAEQIERPKIGRVKQVFEHVTDDDDSNFEVDVEVIASADKQYRAIPWENNQAGEVRIPKVGDKVIVEYRGTSKKSAIARNVVYTNETRPPKARAGMWRKRIDSGPSPAGNGDLYVESYTDYEKNPARSEFDPNTATPESSYVRIAKKADDSDETIDDDTIPMMFELFDNPNGDESHMTIELNKRDGSDTTNTWGIRFDLKTGEMKVLDAGGYGIESDGDGNFTWHYKTLDYSKDTTTSL